MFEGLQATMAERVTSILASDNMFMERIQENMEFTLLPTYRIWLEYVFRGKGVDREEAASFAAGCIKRLAEPLLDAGYGIEKILCYIINIMPSGTNTWSSGFWRMNGISGWMAIPSW